MKQQPGTEFEMVSDLRSLLGRLGSIRDPDHLTRSLLEWIGNRLQAEVAILLLKNTWRVDQFISLALEGDAPDKIAFADGQKTHVPVLVGTPYLPYPKRHSTVSFKEIYLTTPEDLRYVQNLIATIRGCTVEELLADSSFRRTPAATLGFSGRAFSEPTHITIYNRREYPPVERHRLWYENNLHSKGLEHAVAVHLAVGDDKIGLLRVGNKISGAYTPDAPNLVSDGFSEGDCEFLQILASFFAIFVKYSQTLQALNDLMFIADRMPKLLATSHEETETKEILTELAVVTSALLNENGANDGVKADIARFEEGEVTILGSTEQSMIGKTFDTPRRPYRPDSRTFICKTLSYHGKLLGSISIESPLANAFPKIDYVNNILSSIGLASTIALTSAAIALRQEEFNQRVEKNAGALSAAQLAPALAHEFGKKLDTLNTSLKQVESSIPDSKSRSKLKAKRHRGFQEIRRLNNNMMDLTRAFRSYKQWVYLNETVLQIKDILKTYLAEEFDGRLSLSIALDKLLDRPSDVSDKDLQDYLRRPGFRKGTPVMVSPNQIKQILVNLVSNAANASADTVDGKITIRTSLDRELKRWKIFVTDYGGRMSSKVAKKMFDLFYSNSGGFGIGLFVVQKYMKQHGGSVKCTYEKLRTTFTLEAPVTGGEPVCEDQKR